MISTSSSEAKPETITDAARGTRDIWGIAFNGTQPHLISEPRPTETGAPVRRKRCAKHDIPRGSLSKTDFRFSFFLAHGRNIQLQRLRPHTRRRLLTPSSRAQQRNSATVILFLGRVLPGRTAEATPVNLVLDGTLARGSG